nr:hypothetical protein [Allomuricauda sp.]
MGTIKAAVIFLCLVFLGSSKKCKAIEGLRQVTTHIRIINHTPYKLTDVSIFSMGFKDLMPKDTTGFKALNFNQLEDNDMIYCVWDGRRLGRYVRFSNHKEKFITYHLDSIDHGILYVSTDMENK